MTEFMRAVGELMYEFSDENWNIVPYGEHT